MAKDKKKGNPETGETDETVKSSDSAKPEETGNAAPEKETETKKDSEKKKSDIKDKAAEEISKLKDELSAANDKFLRTAAEYQNFRTRSQKEKEAIYNDSKADTLAKLIPVMDNFERAAAAEASPEDYKKGIEMTVKQFSETLTSLGVESFGEAGEPFDPNIHNGISHIDDENLGENVIATVYQKGYRIGDRIVRHAMVVVAN